MTTLSIIVPTDSVIDSYLANVGFVYDKIVRSSEKTQYKILSTSQMDLISFLISKFSLKDFCICCKRGKYTFRVRS